MNQNQDFSDEILNAFIDEQLDHDEHAQIISALRYDEALTQRICDLQKTRSLVQLAFSKKLVPAHQQPVLRSTKQRLWSKSIAASILIMVGVLSGWFAHQQMLPQNSLIELAKTVQHNQIINKNEPWRVMFHVSHNEARRFNILLDETEYLLAQYKKNNKPIQVEILTNGKGVNLIKNETSLQAAKLQELKAKYSNLVVSACGKTLQRIKKQTGKNVTLLPDTEIVRSALHQVTQHQKQGWTYIRI